MLTAGPITVKSSRVRDPDIAIHDVPDVGADAVVQRRTTDFAVLFVQGCHGLTAFGHSSAADLRRPTGSLSGKMASRPSPMNFSISPPCRGNRLRDCVENNPDSKDQ